MLNSSFIPMLTPLRNFIFLFSCIFVVLIANKTLAIDSTQETQKIDKKRRLFDPHCGVYCVYSEIKLNNKDIEFSELLKPEYIGSKLGSSLGELKKAMDKYNMHSVAIKGLTTRDLRKLKHHAILHVKSDPSAERYNHFVLYLGTRENKAILLDPPRSTELVPFKNIAPIWDSAALIVSADPINSKVILSYGKKRFLLYTSIVTFFIILIHWSKRWWSDLVNTASYRGLLQISIAQSIGIVIVSSLFGVIYHFINDEGLLSNTSQTNSVQQAHLGDFAPKLKLAQVSKLTKKDIVFVDARYDFDYKAGHIDGAISIPIGSSTTERQKAMNNIPKSTPIVIYCQSSKCKFAENVLANLKHDGFENISIFKGGWLEWKNKKNTTRKQ